MLKIIDAVICLRNVPVIYPKYMQMNIDALYVMAALVIN